MRKHSLPSRHGLAQAHHAVGDAARERRDDAHLGEVVLGLLVLDLRLAQLELEVVDLLVAHVALALELAAAVGLALGGFERDLGALDRERRVGRRRAGRARPLLDPLALFGDERYDLALPARHQRRAVAAPRAWSSW